MTTSSTEQVLDPLKLTTSYPKRTLHTVPQFCQAHPAFSPGGIRWLLFHRESNGLSKAVLRVGRRILIDEDAFFQWLDGQNENAYRRN